MQDQQANREIYNNFFSPLNQDDNADDYYLSFPGFGFWTRDQAQLLAEVTRDSPDLVADHGTLCSVISYLFNNSENVTEADGSTVAMCPPYWDDLSCFPATEVGQLSVIPCPQYILKTPYDTSRKCIYFVAREHDSWHVVIIYSCVQTTITDDPILQYVAPFELPSFSMTTF